MFRSVIFATICLVLNSCCYCVINVPELYPIPAEWELVEVSDADATDVIPPEVNPSK